MRNVGLLASKTSGIHSQQLLIGTSCLPTPHMGNLDHSQAGVDGVMGHLVPCVLLSSTILDAYVSQFSYLLDDMTFQHSPSSVLVNNQPFIFFFCRTSVSAAYNQLFSQKSHKYFAKSKNKHICHFCKKKQQLCVLSVLLKIHFG